MVKKGLGKGLSALITENPAVTEPSGERVQLLPLTQLMANPGQPRRYFDEAALAELATSIQENGLIQPLVVRPLSDEEYQIIAGERRYRAAILAGCKEVPCIVRRLDDSQALEMALIENIQREDLQPLEEAASFQELLESCGYTQETLAGKIGKSRPYISNSLRLLTLPEAVQELLRQGKLTAGHARAILLLNNKAQRAAMARRVVAEDWSVRRAERYAKEQNELAKGTAMSRVSSEKTVDDLILEDVERRLQHKLGTKAKVQKKGDGKGRILLEYYSNDDLNRLLAYLLPDETF